MNDNLTTSKNGLEFITRWEGLVLKPYRDAAGLRTIGVGHLIKPDENFPDGISITKEKALEILAKDVKICEDAIKKNTKVTLNQNQFDALVSFSFNCGTGVLSNSGVALSVNSGDFAKVPDRLLEWSKARINGSLQVVQGLYNRRKAEGDLFLTPQTGAIISEFPVKWTSESLKEAQRALQKLGLYNMAIDGIWGPGSNRAVSEFAKSKKITIVDPSRGVAPSFLNELKKAAFGS